VLTLLEKRMRISKQRRNLGRGFTIVELAATTVVGVVGICCWAAMSATGVGEAGGGDPPATSGQRGEGEAEKAGDTSPLSRWSKARAEARQLKDSIHVRSIMQSMMIFAQNNKGSFPLPGLIDGANSTVALAEGQTAFSKNTTANIMSILIFNGNISPEICISPAEVNKRIKPFDTYSYGSPATAPNPAQALWDPAFSADFTKRPEGGNFSYAHLQPSEKRRSKWADTFSTTEAIVSNRAPSIASVELDEQGEYVVKLRSDKSKTFRIHGDPKTWEGNVAFNDGHVEYVTSLGPKTAAPAGAGEAPNVSMWPSYSATDAKEADKSKLKLDCYFYDETDDATPGTNLYLGIWTKAGDTAKEFKGIWD